MSSKGEEKLSRDCPSRKQLADFLKGILAEPFIERIGVHLDSCHSCSLLLEQMENGSTTSGGLPVQKTLQGTLPDLSKPAQHQATLLGSENESVGETSATPNRSEDFPHDEAESDNGNFEKLIRCTIEKRKFDEREGRWQVETNAGIPEASSQRTAPPAIEWKEVARVSPGATFGPYYLKRVLGEGAVGIVFLALRESESDGAAETSSVVLKILKPARSKQGDVLRRFDREVRAVTALRHPGLVTATDSGIIDELPFLEMPFLNGESVQELLNRCLYLRPEAAVELVRQVAEALSYIHDQGWIHRDLKPSNLFLTDEGQVKILDLGLTRFLSESVDELITLGNNEAASRASRVTKAGSRMGTRAYMAPEQWVDSASVGFCADIYSLGCMLHKLLTGRHYGEPATARARDAEAGAWVPAEVAPELLDLIEEMVALDPAKRIQQSREVASRLADWLQNQASIEVDSDPASLLSRENLKYQFPHSPKRDLPPKEEWNGTSARPQFDSRASSENVQVWATSSSPGIQSSLSSDHPPVAPGHVQTGITPWKGFVGGALIMGILALLFVIPAGALIGLAIYSNREIDQSPQLTSSSPSQRQIENFPRTHQKEMSSILESLKQGNETQRNPSSISSGFSDVTDSGFPVVEPSSHPFSTPSEGSANSPFGIPGSLGRMSRPASIFPYGGFDRGSVDETKTKEPYLRLASGHLVIENSKELMTENDLRFEMSFRVQANSSTDRTLLAAGRTPSSRLSPRTWFEGWAIELETIGTFQQLVWVQGHSRRHLAHALQQRPHLRSSPHSAIGFGSKNEVMPWIKLEVIQSESSYQVLVDGRDVGSFPRVSNLEDQISLPKLPWDDATSKTPEWLDLVLGAMPNQIRYQPFDGDIRAFRITRGATIETGEEAGREGEVVLELDFGNTERDSIPNLAAENYTGQLVGGGRVVNPLASSEDVESDPTDSNQGG